MLISYAINVKAQKVPTGTRFLLDQFSQQIRYHRLSIPKIGPKIDGFFGSKPKPKKFIH